jgi:hypothetical protein
MGMTAMMLLPQGTRLVEAKAVEKMATMVVALVAPLVAPLVVVASGALRANIQIRPSIGGLLFYRRRCSDAMQILWSWHQGRT